jgi:hypothetical protein
MYSAQSCKRLSGCNNALLLHDWFIACTHVCMYVCLYVCLLSAWFPACMHELYLCIYMWMYVWGLTVEPLFFSVMEICVYTCIDTHVYTQQIIPACCNKLYLRVATNYTCVLQQIIPACCRSDGSGVCSMYVCMYGWMYVYTHATSDTWMLQAWWR